MTGEIYVYFSRPNDTVESQPPLGPVRFGPFEEFIQLTYHELRVGPDGDFIAWFDLGSGGVWRVHGDRSETELDCWYSDIVITEREE